MKLFNSILVATDFSIEGNNAVRRATLLAQEHGARLNLAHVLDPSGQKPLWELLSARNDIAVRTADARERLLRLADEAAGQPGVATSIEVMVGERIETMRRASERADLLVLGWRPRNRFAAVIGGRSVERLLRASRCPVLVVRTPVDGRYERVLVPVDFKAPSEAAAQLAARMAREGSVRVIHAVSPRREALLRDTFVSEHVIREFRTRLEVGTIARMRRKAARLGLDSTRMSFAVGHGHPVWSTLSHARRLGADLIVAGEQHGSALGDWLMGSISSRILSASRSDMIFVPQTPMNAGAPATMAPLRMTSATC